MNIGIDIRAAKWYRGTGLGTYTFQLIKTLNTLDKNNKYTLYNDHSTLDINLNNNFYLIPVSSTKSNNFWENVETPIALENKDLQLYHIPQNGIGLPLEGTTPYVITLHDTIPLHMPETVSDKYLTLFNNSMEKIIKNCAGIITVSEYSKNDIAKDFNFPLDKIYVTYLASEDIYTPINKSLCQRVLKKHYFNANNYILYVGGFSPRKNISGLIKAFKKVKPFLPPDIKLVIAGTKGKSYSIYKQLTQDLDLEEHIIFPGFIEMEYMPYLYSGASVLVYPSFYEGFGLPPIEAMASGVPVIASNVTSIPEILGDSALLCNPFDIDALGEALFSVLWDDSLRKDLILKGFKKSSSLTWENTAKETLKAYEGIINT